MFLSSSAGEFIEEFFLTRPKHRRQSKSLNWWSGGSDKTKLDVRIQRDNVFDPDQISWTIENSELIDRSKTANFK